MRQRTVVLVATHFNTGAYHNHLVVNAVNMWDGKKFNCNEGAYWKLRGISDETAITTIMTDMYLWMKWAKECDLTT